MTDTKEAKAFRAQQEEALRTLNEKDPGFDTDIAGTNERLAASANTDPDFVKASIDLNNPVGSSAAYRDPKAEQKVADAREKALDELSKK